MKEHLEIIDCNIVLIDGENVIMSYLAADRCGSKGFTSFGIKLTQNLEVSKIDIVDEFRFLLFLSTTNDEFIKLTSLHKHGYIGN